MNQQATAVHTSQSIDNTAQDETMEAAFQEFLDNNYAKPIMTKEQVDKLRFTFYSGAQAVLDAADPLSRIAALQAELSDYLAPPDNGFASPEL